MRNVKFGSMKHLVIQIVAICVVGIILYPLFDLVLCNFITHSVFHYSIHSYIIQPIIFGIIMGTVIWIMEK